MKKLIKCLIICLESVLIFIIVGAFTTAVSKQIYSSILIENFKKNGVYSEKDSAPNIKVFRIESDEELEAFQRIGNVYYPGATGDILLSLKSEINIPIANEIISFFAGGHAALVLGDYQDALDVSTNLNTLECSGIGEDNNLAKLYTKSYWYGTHPYKEVIGVRVKTTQQQRNRVVSEAMALIGDQYNYTFITNTEKKSYCTDIICKAYEKIGINLNKDSFTTSVYDLLVTGETYISYYHYIDTAGIKYIYYLA